VLKENLWWEQENWDEILKMNSESGVFTPFCIKTVEKGKNICSTCNILKRCNGCILPPSCDIIEDFFPKSNLIIEWNSELIESQYNSSATDLIIHNST